VDLRNSDNNDPKGARDFNSFALAPYIKKSLGGLGQLVKVNILLFPSGDWFLNEWIILFIKEGNKFDYDKSIGTWKLIESKLSEVNKNFYSQVATSFRTIKKKPRYFR